MYCIALHCIALHCIALHCIALHCIALHCIALHCIALHCNRFSNNRPQSHFCCPPNVLHFLSTRRSKLTFTILPRVSMSRHHTAKSQSSKENLLLSCQWLYNDGWIQLRNNNQLVLGIGQDSTEVQCRHLKFFSFSGEVCLLVCVCFVSVKKISR